METSGLIDCLDQKGVSILDKNTMVLYKKYWINKKNCTEKFVWVKVISGSLRFHICMNIQYHQVNKGRVLATLRYVHAN